MVKLRSGTRKILATVNARKDLRQTSQGRKALADKLRAHRRLTGGSTLQRSQYKSGKVQA